MTGTTAALADRRFRESLRQDIGHAASLTAIRDDPDAFRDAHQGANQG